MAKDFTHTFFLFVDGLGWAPAGPDNPVTSAGCPCLSDLLAHHAVPIDAGLGWPGVPQSATGQTALWTGTNAARLLGRHQEGFPGPALREIVEQSHIFGRLAELGCRCAFANAYFIDEQRELLEWRRLSVSSVMTLAAFGRVRDKRDLAAGKAVYQDLTRESLVPRGYTGALVTPEESARDALALIAEHDFTLFEYFQTDHAGHGGDRKRAEQALGLLDRFLAVLRPELERPGHRLILTSDHGNIEDLSHSRHTENPVPLITLGESAQELRERIRRIEEVTPAIVDLYGAERRRP
jgi:2,3-bisphosphoglycerate-independent phosphoglycerate mutase